jgi:hypothetical protein
LTAGTRDHGHSDFRGGTSSGGTFGTALRYTDGAGYQVDNTVTLGGTVRLADVARLERPLAQEAPAGAVPPADEAPLEGVLVRSHRAVSATGGRRAQRYTGRHASPRRKTARIWRAGKVVPVAAAAAALVAGTTTAVVIFGSGGHTQPQPRAGQLSAAIGLPGAALAAQPGSQNAAAAAALVQVARDTASAGTAPKKAAAKPAASPRASAPAATPSKTAKPSPSATSSAAKAPASAATLSCSLNYGMLPANVTAIVSFLLASGYSDNAAAGIAGNIYQESKGNPESVGTGGGGLIGWTPLPAGFVTGNVSADLEFQLNQILSYNQGWASYIPELNAAATPADAAYIYVTKFERAGIPAAYNRETAATEVAQSCGI